VSSFSLNNQADVSISKSGCFCKGFFCRFARIVKLPFRLSLWSIGKVLHYSVRNYNIRTWTYQLVIRFKLLQNVVFSVIATKDYHVTSPGPISCFIAWTVLGSIESPSIRVIYGNNSCDSMASRLCDRMSISTPITLPLFKAYISGHNKSIILRVLCPSLELHLV
jgi:hypothetical protein